MRYAKEFTDASIVTVQYHHAKDCVVYNAGSWGYRNVVNVYVDGGCLTMFTGLVWRFIPLAGVQWFEVR